MLDQNYKEQTKSSRARLQPSGKQSPHAETKPWITYSMILDPDRGACNCKGQYVKDEENDFNEMVIISYVPSDIDADSC
jgi:hypothetical protein